MLGGLSSEPTAVAGRTVIEELDLASSSRLARLHLLLRSVFVAHFSLSFFANEAEEENEPLPTLSLLSS